MRRAMRCIASHDPRWQGADELRLADARQAAEDYLEMVNQKLDLIAELTGECAGDFCTMEQVLEARRR